MATPEMRWNAQASIPSLPRYRQEHGASDVVAVPPAGSVRLVASGAAAARRPSEPRDDRVGELARAGRAAEVVGRRPALGDDLAERAPRPARRRRCSPRWRSISDAGQDQGRRVGLVQAGVLGRGAVDRLEDGRLRADVGAGRDPEPADEARRTGRSRCRRTGSAGPGRRTAPASARAACTCCRRSGPRTRSCPS